MPRYTSSRPRTRVVVRPWTPRHVPYAITITSLEDILVDAYPKLQKVLYVGWTKRRIAGKLTLLYLAATGETTQEARRAFKNSEAYNECVWNLTDIKLK